MFSVCLYPQDAFGSWSCFLSSHRLLYYIHTPSNTEFSQRAWGTLPIVTGIGYWYFIFGWIPLVNLPLGPSASCSSHHSSVRVVPSCTAVTLAQRGPEQSDQLSASSFSPQISWGYTQKVCLVAMPVGAFLFYQIKDSRSCVTLSTAFSLPFHIDRCSCLRFFSPPLCIDLLTLSKCTWHMLLSLRSLSMDWEVSTECAQHTGGKRAPDVISK